MEESQEVFRRLDLACVEFGLIETRNKAHRLIEMGKVCVNGIVCQKNSHKVCAKDSITLLENTFYVSRAGEKLDLFLKSHSALFGAFQEISALDIGASAGGFSEVLLRRGVLSLVCVDVGSEQLHKSLRENPCVEYYEKTDIRDFAKKTKRKFELVVCDVSFIALKDILESIKTLALKFVILLFKPQFEVGREAKRNKRGVLKESESTIKALNGILQLLGQNFKILVCEESKIRGKEGNLEFFIACQRF